MGEPGQDEIILKLTPPWGLRVLFSILLKMLQMCIINGTEVFNSNDSLLCVGKYLLKEGSAILYYKSFWII